MRTVKKEVLRDMMQQLRRYGELFSCSVRDWKTYDGVYLGHGKYELDRQNESAISLGDRWYARYDCARIFYADVTLDESFRGKKLYLNLDFGGEILVRLDGEIAGSVSSRMNSGWVARDTVVLKNDLLKFSEPMRIELEACVDSGGFCNAAMAGEKQCEYQLKAARFVAVDPVCEKYYIDCDLIWEALEQIRDEFIKQSVYKALDDSLHMVDFDFDEPAVRESIAAASRYLDGELAKIKYTPQAQVIMDGHSHIDIAWLWRIQESERKAARTFSSILNLMDEYPDFTFTQSQAILYDMIKENYPELFERIREKVKNGQWGVVGNTWVECDTNIASGEAMVRQLLYGREFFIREFGVSSDIYWLPDCFGFSWALPQIIKRSGMKYFITAKLANQDTNRFPHTLFRWRGADGSEILAYNQRTHYQGEFSPEQVYNTAYTNDQKDAVQTTFGMFGYGDGGGGCTHRMLENARRLKAFPGLPESKMGHPGEFFSKAQQGSEELPVYCDELYYENHRGTYTSQAFIKKGNRKGELLLTRAEMASVFASRISGLEYETAKLERLWKTLLKNQFHDILPGTSIHEAMEDCRPDYAEIQRGGNELLSGALGSITSEIGVPECGVVVWNLLGHTVTAPVRLTAGGEYTEFIARDVPSMGWKFFPVEDIIKEAAPVKAQPGLLENDLLRVTLDENGILTSVYDKVNCRETLSGRGNELSVFIDKCVHETAWNLEKNYMKKQWVLEKADSVEVVESSSLRGVIRTVRSFNKSVITQDIMLYAGSAQVEFDTCVDWHERDKMLKASFEVSVMNSFATFEAAHGAIKRPTHSNNPFDGAKFEQCAHKWADLSEGDYGVSILNDCKYGYDISGSRMRITLMRAPTCPDTAGDIGVNTFKYSFYPHAGSWQQAQTVRRALEMNVPLYSVPVEAKKGALAQSGALIECSRGNIVTDALKMAQDGRGVILRVYESDQCRGEARLTVNLKFERVIECNLMEQDERELETDGNSFSFGFRPFEVKTFRLV